jgi:hypothetical protein
MLARGCLAHGAIYDLRERPVTTHPPGIADKNRPVALPRNRSDGQTAAARNKNACDQLPCNAWTHRQGVLLRQANAMEDRDLCSGAAGTSQKCQAVIYEFLEFIVRERRKTPILTAPSHPPDVRLGYSAS